MDEMLKAFLNLGISGAALIVFWKLMSQMLESHKVERQASQASFQTTLDTIVQNFREEVSDARESCKEENRITAEAFERNLEKIRVGWGK